MCGGGGGWSGLVWVSCMVLHPAPAVASVPYPVPLCLSPLTDLRLQEGHTCATMRRWVHFPPPSEPVCPPCIRFANWRSTKARIQTNVAKCGARLFLVCKRPRLRDHISRARPQAVSQSLKSHDPPSACVQRAFSSLDVSPPAPFHPTYLTPFAISQRWHRYPRTVDTQPTKIVSVMSCEATS